MKGDRVEVVVDVGEGVRSFVISATRAGRRVEVSTARGVVEVVETTRTGRAIRFGRFMATRVVALVEHPAAEPDDDVAAGAAHRLSQSRRRADTGQQSLL